MSLLATKINNHVGAYAHTRPAHLTTLVLHPSGASATIPGMASKGGKKIDQAELKKLIDEHRGKPVETVWGGGSKWSRIGFDRGVKGRIVGWGADGPQVEVDPEYRVWAACQKFFPGSRANPEKWGEGTTWRFTKAKKG